jgi:glucosyl-3-phosphoglycerate synthase
MADFYQHAAVPTLHHLASPDLGSRQDELLQLTRERPVVLLLPALHEEIQRPALPNILRHVGSVPYVSQVVLTMNGMNRQQMQETRRLCQQWLGAKKLTLLWNDGPGLHAVHEQIDGGQGSTVSGKGANIWMGIAYLRAMGHRGIIVSHDTDILNYCPSLLAKLVYPIAHPRLGYRFAKGYYSRVAGRLYGRVTRLLIFPLLQAFRSVLPGTPLLEHLQSFRYPLSGEFAADADSIAQFSVPSAWGLEVAMLAEVHRQLKQSEMCQVDLGLHYEHRHRQLQPGTVEPGLVTAAADVARSLTEQILRDHPMKTLTSVLSELLPIYRQHSVDWMDRYEHVALLNGLHYDRLEENCAVLAFTEALQQLAAGHHPHPESVLRASPAATLAAHPDLAQSIIQAVRDDAE